MALGTRLLLFALAVWLGALCIALLDVPFLSEDFTHLAAAERHGSWLSAFDLTREPLRPGQHLLFAFGAALDDPAPGLLRSVSLALHLACCVLVFLVARQVGLGSGAAAGAALLFALFPNIKGIAWSAAISTPGRSAFVLAGFLAFLRWRASASRVAGVASVAALLLALCFHESGFVLPAVCAAWCLCAGQGGLRARIAALWAEARRPVLALQIALAASYVVYLAFLRPERHHGLKSLSSLPANLVKAASSTWPELARVPLVEGLRGADGTLAAVVAGLVLAGFCLWAARVVWSDSALARFAVLAVALDLALPALGAGFNQRYAYLSSAWIALALAGWAAASARGRVVACVLGGAWAFDSLVDLGEYRAAGTHARRFVEQACAERARLDPARTLLLVDPVDVWGRERDIPVFNWGLPEALERAGCAGAWRFGRRGPYRTGTHVELVEQAELAREAERGVRILVRDPATDELRPWP